MGTCSYCGTAFPKTRATRKYCKARCKTNACLTRKPRRLRAADVAAVHDLLDGEFASADHVLERLRAIVAPGRPRLPIENGRPLIPKLD